MAQFYSQLLYRGEERLYPSHMPCPRSVIEGSYAMCFLISPPLLFCSFPVSLATTLDTGKYVREQDGRGSCTSPTDLVRAFTLRVLAFPNHLRQTFPIRHIITNRRFVYPAGRAPVSESHTVTCVRVHIEPRDSIDIERIMFCRVVTLLRHQSVTCLPCIAAATQLCSGSV